jgi:hypothetical protein
MTEIEALKLARSMRLRGYYVRVDVSEGGYDVHVCK